MLPFGVPDDLASDELLVLAAPAPTTYACEVTVVHGWRDSGGYVRTADKPCTCPAKYRMQATDKTNEGEWVAIPRMIPFKVGEIRNVCGTHRTVLQRRDWTFLEDLPQVGSPE